MTTSQTSMHTPSLQTDDMLTEKAATNTVLLTIFQENVATLEALTAEGRAQINALQAEVTELAVQLHNTQTRIANLSAVLLAQEGMLATLKAGMSTTSVVPHQAPGSPDSATTLASPIQHTSKTVPPTTPHNVGHTATPHAEPASTPTSKRQTASQPVSLADGATQSAAAQARVSPQSVPTTTRARERGAAPVEQEVFPTQPTPSHERPVDPVGCAEVSTASVTPAQSRSEQPVAAPTQQSAPNTRTAPVASAPATSAPHAQPPVADKVVRRGSSVEIIFDSDPDGSIETYTIVRSNEAKPMQNLIAEDSPLGQALLGARPGEVRQFRVRSGPEQIVHVQAVHS